MRFENISNANAIVQSLKKLTSGILIAGMLPVAIGIGEGSEFYRPMATAIIGGTITSTILTLLIIPSFYDSIELTREAWGRRLKALGQRFT